MKGLEDVLSVNVDELRSVPDLFAYSFFSKQFLLAGSFAGGKRNPQRVFAWSVLWCAFIGLTPSIRKASASVKLARIYLRAGYFRRARQLCVAVTAVTAATVAPAASAPAPTAGPAAREMSLLRYQACARDLIRQIEQCSAQVRALIVGGN